MTKINTTTITLHSEIGREMAKDFSAETLNQIATAMFDRAAILRDYAERERTEGDKVEFMRLVNDAACMTRIARDLDTITASIDSK